MAPAHSTVFLSHRNLVLNTRVCPGCYNFMWPRWIHRGLGSLLACLLSTGARWCGALLRVCAPLRCQIQQGITSVSVLQNSPKYVYYLCLPVLLRVSPCVLGGPLLRPVFLPLGLFVLSWFSAWHAHSQCRQCLQGPSSWSCVFGGGRLGGMACTELLTLKN